MRDQIIRMLEQCASSLRRILDRPFVGTVPQGQYKILVAIDYCEVEVAEHVQPADVNEWSKEIYRLIREAARHYRQSPASYLSELLEAIGAELTQFS